MTNQTNGSSASNAAIILDRVTKQYYIQQRASPRLGAWLVNKLFEHFRRVPFLALDDVSLTINRGEMVGFLGSNGAGKSTTLKLIAGITQPTSGRVTVRGRVASMLELGVGFHPDLSGMENIFLNASMLGLSRGEVMDRLGSIIAFSGLEPFIYEPVKHYSSGMYARLACSVAMHVDPDIVLVDEILSVGDAEFQHRAMMRLLEMHEAGATVLLVTHSVGPAQLLCGRMVWLNHGRLIADGESETVADQYYTSQNMAAIPGGHFLHPVKLLDRDKPARIASCALLNSQGEAMSSVMTGDGVDVVFQVEAKNESLRACRLAFAIVWPDNRVMFEDSIHFDPAIDSHMVYRVERWPLLRREMKLIAALVDPETNDVIDQYRLDFTTESPVEHKLPKTAVHLSAAWQVERLD